MMDPMSVRAFAPLVAILIATIATAQNDEAYAKKVKEYTTEPFFLTDLVDHLPTSKTVPSPDKFLGHIVGAPNVLSYSQQCADYLRLLEKTSPRVKVFSMGKSEEGREMVVAAISDDANIKNLDRLRQISATLSDPRKLKGTEDAANLLALAVPMYWVTGSMHAPETGPPEMIMELAYRLAVSDDPMIQTIRKNEVVLLTPVLDVDGRDRVVDLYKYRKANPTKQPIPLVYWGHYVAHDDNRDAMTLTLNLSKAMMKLWLDFHPIVQHDLHESVPYLYISTGTGPYNAWFDPILISEWQEMAYNEIQGMTVQNVPGVWTHGFYDGWAASYGIVIANAHNGIGRFYETFSAGGADTAIRNVGDDAERDWYRPNPPYPNVRWSIRDNVNLSESALLMGMNKVASEKDKFLRNFYLKSQRSVAKAKTEGPAAWVLPTPVIGGRESALLNVFRLHGVEVHRLDEEAKIGATTFPVGSYVIRMDQPYSRVADMFLDSQYYNSTDPRSYDDTGWQLGALFNLSPVRVKDATLLDKKMTLLADPIAPTSNVGSAGAGTWAIKADGDFLISQLRYSAHQLGIATADKAFKDGTTDFPAGTALIPAVSDKVTLEQFSKLGITVTPLKETPKTAVHPLEAPRIAVVHTWTNTQDEGWTRIALDQLKIPYTYVSVHELADVALLKAKYDVILLPQAGGSAQSIVNGIPMLGDPLPWKATKDYPNLGGPDSSDDIRGGIGLNGVVHLQSFINDGGLLICVGNTCRIPIDYGLVKGVSITPVKDLDAPGGVYLTERVDKESPVLYGYGETLPVYFNANSLPMLSVGFSRGGNSVENERPSGRGNVGDPDVIQGRPPYTPKSQPGDTPAGGTYKAPTDPNLPRVLLRFVDRSRLLMSGRLAHPEELVGKAALVDCPSGKGHVLLCAMNPTWRGETMGAYQLLLNAAMNWKSLSPVPDPPKK